MGRNSSTIGNQRNKKTGKNKYKQGHYLLKNVDKYIGITPIVYRSSWEFAFCRFCDFNDNILKWSSESLEIPYQITNNLGQLETHRYYPDFYVEMTNPINPEKYDRFVFEIKPKMQTEKPIEPKKQTLKTLESYHYSLKEYKKNLFKWSYTKEWCERHHLTFLIITEDDLKKRGLIN